MKVLIAGGGIGGLTLALTCHQLGIPFKVFEQVGALKPLGVGINLQPVAVRELYDLGLEEKVEQVGIRTRDFGLYTSKGLHVWTEHRGEWAGYAWPQYSIHRGHLHMLLYDTLIDRAGTECIATGMSAVGFENTSDGIALQLQSANGEDFLENGSVLVGADGIHSSIRRQMNPEEGDPVWGGSVLWRANQHH